MDVKRLAGVQTGPGQNERYFENRGIEERFPRATGPSAADGKGMYFLFRPVFLCALVQAATIRCAHVPLKADAKKH